MESILLSLVLIHVPTFGPFKLNKMLIHVKFVTIQKEAIYIWWPPMAGKNEDGILPLKVGSTHSTTKVEF